MKKITTISFFLLLFATLLSSQSLVELAKKEKERRTKLEDKKGIVVTNAHLAKFKGKPAVSVRQTAFTDKQTPRAARGTISSPSRKSPSSVIKKIGRKSSKDIVRLEEKWKKTNEYAELLTLKINGLQQKFYSFRDWTLRDEIQREISETYLKLQKAQKDAEEAKKELDKQRVKKRK